MPSPCSVEGCPNNAVSRGLCQAHYMRQRRKIPLDAPLRPRREDAGTAFTARVNDQTAAELEKEAKKQGVSSYQVASEVLERWAARRRAK